MSYRDLLKELCYLQYTDMEDGNHTETIDYQSLAGLLEEIIDRLDRLEGEVKFDDVMDESKKDGGFNEQENDNNFKTALDHIEEWAEKNKNPSLYGILMEWWINLDWTDPTDESIIDNLVDLIDDQFIPPHHDTNDYQWNKCLKLMREKLR